MTSPWFHLVLVSPCTHVLHHSCILTSLHLNTATPLTSSCNLLSPGLCNLISSCSFLSPRFVLQTVSPRLAICIFQISVSSLSLSRFLPWLQRSPSVSPLTLLFFSFVVHPSFSFLFSLFENPCHSLQAFSSHFTPPNLSCLSSYYFFSHTLSLFFSSLFLSLSHHH